MLQQEFLIKNQDKQDKQKLLNQLPLDIINRIFINLHWRDWASISKVSTQWRFFIYQFCDIFSETYFPYLKGLPGYAQSPVEFIVKEGQWYEKGFPKSEMLLILTALNGKELIASQENEKERIQSYSLFLTSNDATLVKNLTKKCQKEIKISAFRYYACSGQLDTIKMYLSTCHYKLINDGFALQGAAKYNQLAVVKHLLLFSKKMREEKGLALRDAAKYGHLNIVKLLLPFTEITREDKGLALRAAAGKGHLKIVELLVLLTEIESQHANTGLINAAKYGHFEVVKYLSSLLQTEFGKAQALIGAAKYGHLEIVKFLLLFREVTPKDKNTALLSAAKYGCLEVVKCLLSTNLQFEKAEALINAVKYGRLETTEYLLSQPSITPQNKGWALVNAARYGYLTIVKSLLSHREITSEDKGQALINAARYGYLEVIKCFSLEEITSEDITLAGSKAAECKHFDITAWLALEKITINSSDEEVAKSLSLLSLAYTPLYAAIKSTTISPEENAEINNNNEISKKF